MKLEIIDTAYGGFGVAKEKNGKTVFIPYSVKGDTIEAHIVKNAKNFSYAKLDYIIKPSDFRIIPKCKYAGICGGCLFSHIDYEYQIKIKETIIKNALRKYKNYLPNIEIIKSCKERYRLRVTAVAKNGQVGFNIFKSNDFINIEDCLITKKTLFDKIKTFAAKNNLTGKIYAIETDSNIMLGDVKSENGVLKDKCFFNGLMFNDKLYAINESYYNTAYGNIGIGNSTFFQANLFLLNDFQNKVFSVTKNSEHITELYAGSGFFTSVLLRKSNIINSSEIDKNAVTLAKKFGYPVELCDSEKYIENIKYTDMIFLDPPREGVTNKIIKNILNLKPKTIVYVSCNPMTLARDIIKMESLYKIEKIILMDMFPDSYHVETIVLLQKENS